MSAFAAPLLQQSIYEHLANASDLTARVSAIYDEPDEAAVPPFIAFGDTRHQPYDTGTTEGATIHFDVLVWSSNMHQMEAKEIMALVDAELHLMNVFVPNYTLVRLVLVSADVTKQQRDANSYARGRMTYKAVMFKDQN